jgi:hypothetical protein
MNNQLFKTGIAILTKIYGYQMDDQVLTLYWDCLKTLSDDDFTRVQANIVKTFIPSSQVPFPLPAHFLSAAGISGQNRSKAAITAIIKASSLGPYKSVSFGDPILHGVIERFGGWPDVCCWDSQKWQFNEKNFIQCYEAAIASGDRGPDHLMGLTEFNNTGMILSDTQKRIIAKNTLKVISWAGAKKSDQKLLETDLLNTPELEDARRALENV